VDYLSLEASEDDTDFIRWVVGLWKP